MYLWIFGIRNCSSLTISAKWCLNGPSIHVPHISFQRDTQYRCILGDGWRPSKWQTHSKRRGPGEQETRWILWVQRCPPAGHYTAFSPNCSSIHTSNPFRFPELIVNHVGFQVLTAATMKSVISADETLCYPSAVPWPFVGTWVNFYRTVRHHVSLANQSHWPCNMRDVVPSIALTLKIVGSNATRDMYAWFRSLCLFSLL
jgi:hypothetical protein